MAQQLYVHMAGIVGPYKLRVPQDKIVALKAGTVVKLAVEAARLLRKEKGLEPEPARWLINVQDAVKEAFRMALPSHHEPEPANVADLTRKITNMVSTISELGWTCDYATMIRDSAANAQELQVDPTKKNASSPERQISRLAAIGPLTEESIEAERAELRQLIRTASPDDRILYACPTPLKGADHGLRLLRIPTDASVLICAGLRPVREKEAFDKELPIHFFQRHDTQRFIRLLQDVRAVEQEDHLDRGRGDGEPLLVGVGFLPVRNDRRVGLHILHPSAALRA